MSALTVDGQVAKCSACSPLDFCVRTIEEEKNGFEGITVDFPDIYYNPYRVSIKSGSYYTSCQSYLFP